MADPFQTTVAQYLAQGQDIPFFVNAAWLTALQKFSSSGIVDPRKIGATGPIITIGDDVFSIESQPDCGPNDQTSEVTGLLISTASTSVGYDNTWSISPTSVPDAPGQFIVPVEYRGEFSVGQVVKISGALTGSYFSPVIGGPTADDSSYLIATITEIVYNTSPVEVQGQILSTSYYFFVDITQRVGIGTHYSWKFILQDGQTELTTQSTQVQQSSQFRYDNIFRGKIDSLFPPNKFFKFNLDGIIRGGSASNGAGGPWATGGLNGPNTNPGNSTAYAVPIVANIETYYSAPETDTTSQPVLILNQQASMVLNDEDLQTVFFKTNLPVYMQGLA